MGKDYANGFSRRSGIAGEILASVAKSSSAGMNLELLNDAAIGYREIRTPVGADVKPLTHSARPMIIQTSFGVDYAVIIYFTKSVIKEPLPPEPEVSAE